ncbi:MAG: lipase maturation factor family protein, partial [Terriglobales bacterium]
MADAFDWRGPPRGWAARPPRAVRATARGFTRWLGFIYFWAFFAWWREASGLIGPHGILPARDLLAAARQQLGFWQRLWAVPSLLWLGSGTAALQVVCGAGMAAAALVMLARWPRPALGACLACFLSLVAAAQVFASYQSDGMLISAGLIALFLDQERPGWWSWFALRWLWFSIYFGSGVAKLQSGDPQWRHWTALNQYYQNLPLPNWLGWYAQQLLPQRVESALALAILGIELGVCWLAFGPRRLRIICFWIVTPFQLGIILTANYGFLNFLVLGLGLA